MKAYTGKYDPDVAAAVLRLMAEHDLVEKKRPPVDVQRLRNKLNLLTEMLSSWEAIRGDAPGAVDHPLAHFLHEQVQAVEQSVFQAGFNLEEPQGLLSIVQQDPDALLEAAFVFDEALYQLDETLNEARRRTRYGTNVPGAVARWMADIEVLLTRSHAA